MRQTGSRNKLITISYDVIGDLAGVAGNSARQYAHRGEYDPRDLDSVLTWVNSRRKRQGQPMIGGCAANQLEADESKISKSAGNASAKFGGRF